jgi:hypothetical protein
MDPDSDPDPAIFAIALQDTNKKFSDFEGPVQLHIEVPVSGSRRPKNIDPKDSDPQHCVLPWWHCGIILVLLVDLCDCC